MVLTGPRKLIGWDRNPHSVHIPLRRRAIEGPLGLQEAGDPTSHEVFIFCGFAQASADSIFIESGPKTAGIRTCLTTQREVSVPWGKKSCPLGSPPSLSPSPVPTLLTRLPSFKVSQSLFILKKSHNFLKTQIGYLSAAPLGLGWWSLVVSPIPPPPPSPSVVLRGGESAPFSWPLGRLNLLVACLAYSRHGVLPRRAKITIRQSSSLQWRL